MVVYKREITFPPSNLDKMKSDFLSISNHRDLAAFFDLTYTELKKIIYETDDRFKYRHFEIPKKNGGTRKIASPSKKLKNIQQKLADALYKIYPNKPSAHGFAKNKSIVTNAKQHLGKKFIFNLDLLDFFDSISFGRVRNLFRSSPFNFSDSVSTILAQICCFKNSLPQGAPTSPILSNLITWKLDSQLQNIAKLTNSTYSRYVDDISFSFTCNKSRLPIHIIEQHDQSISPGKALTKTIENNGFFINYEKVRLCDIYGRMEVTGITVNEFPNVKRKYIRQISSMLYAWRKHGYELAELEFNKKYNFKHRAYSTNKSFLHVLKGKLAYLKNVRTDKDPIYNKLIKQYNELAEPEYRFKPAQHFDDSSRVTNSLWVIETYYEDNEGQIIASQGTGFTLGKKGIITCAHVVGESVTKKIHRNLIAYKLNDTDTRYNLTIERICYHRDIAICCIDNNSIARHLDYYLEPSNNDPYLGMPIKLVGFPGVVPGQTHFETDSNIVRIGPQNGVLKFEINTQIKEGISGGPVIDDKARVVGVALEGAVGKAGQNGCLRISEIDAIIDDDSLVV